MIVKIESPNPGILSAVQYNEKKMDGAEGIRPSEEDRRLRAIEDGHVLATRNVPKDSSLVKEFNRLKSLSERKRRSGPAIRNFTFHMSVNPSDSDRPLGEPDAVALIDEIMASLGYAQQPYRIYKHTDIARMHYHVVSCRAGQDGKKIDDSFERVKLRKSLAPLAEKYGFEIILNEEEIKASKKASKKAAEKPGKDSALALPVKEPKVAQKARKEPKKESGKPDFVPSFSTKNEKPVTEQVRDICEDALKWHFSTFEQFQHLLRRRYNVVVEIERGEDADRAVLAGVKSDGTPATELLDETVLGLPLLKRLTEKLESEKMSQRKQQKERLENLTRAAAAASDTYKEFIKTMERKGVWVVLAWKKDGDEAFGITYLDRATKCAWKGSESTVDLKWLKKVAAEKGWTLEKDSVPMPRREIVRAEKKGSPVVRTDVLPAQGRGLSRGPSLGQLLRSLPSEEAKGGAGRLPAEKDRDEGKDDRDRKHIEYIGE